MSTALKQVTPMYNKDGKVDYAATQEQLADLKRRGFLFPKAAMKEWPQNAYEKATGKIKPVNSSEELDALGAGWSLEPCEPPKPAAPASPGATAPSAEIAELKASLDVADKRLTLLEDRLSAVEELLTDAAPAAEQTSKRGPGRPAKTPETTA